MPPVAPWRGRLVVLAGIVLVGLNLRIAVAAVSPIIDVVRQDFTLTDTQVGLLGTVPVASFAVFGSLATPVARRLGLEPTMVLALLLSMSGELLRALAGSAPAFIGWSVIALGGLGMGNVLLPPLVKRYFPDRIGTVTAAYSVAMSVSTAVPPLVALPVAQAAGWRWSVGMWAILGFAAVVPWVVVIAQSVSARRTFAPW
jgi:CP family cyanate transporter-like MFS transporter